MSARAAPCEVPAIKRNIFSGWNEPGGPQKQTAKVYGRRADVGSDDPATSTSVLISSKPVSGPRRNAEVREIVMCQESGFRYSFPTAGDPVRTSSGLS